MEQNSEIIIYTALDGTTKIQVQLENETVWLTQYQMAMLFGKAKSTINEHIKNIYSEKELEESQTLKRFGISEFQEKVPNYYSLDVIISVGYRVKSKQGTKFRQWATKRIHEYIVKGFTMDDDRLKQDGAGSRYFEELLERIRDIKSSIENVEFYLIINQVLLYSSQQYLGQYDYSVLSFDNTILIAEKIKILNKFSKSILNNIKDIEPEYSAMVDEKFWDLL